jgi:hypothetical protein
MGVALEILYIGQIVIYLIAVATKCTKHLQMEPIGRTATSIPISSKPSPKSSNPRIPRKSFETAKSGIRAHAGVDDA